VNSFHFKTISKMGVFVLGGGPIKKINHQKNNVNVVTPTN
jgi:hypothetical protein